MAETPEKDDGVLPARFGLVKPALDLETRDSGRECLPVTVLVTPLLPLVRGATLSGERETDQTRAWGRARLDRQSELVK